MYRVTAPIPRSAGCKSAVSTAAASTAPVLSSAQSSCGNPPSVTLAYPTTVGGAPTVPSVSPLGKDADVGVDAGAGAGAGGNEMMTMRAALVAFGHAEPDPKDEVAT